MTIFYQKGSISVEKGRFRSREKTILKNRLFTDFDFNFPKVGRNPKSKTDHFRWTTDDFRLKCLFSVWKARFWSGNTSNLKIHGFLPSFFGFSSSKFKCNSIETVIESDENLIIRKDSVAFEIIPIISEVIQCSKTKWS